MRTYATVALVIGCAGCAGRSVPSPQEAAHAYSAAVFSGNAAALFESMTPSAQQRRNIGDVQAAVRNEQASLVERAHGWTSPDATVVTTAVVRLADGEEAFLVLDRGGFKISSAAALPGGARTPQEALRHLRLAIARRNYAAVFRMVTPMAGRKLEEQLRSLVDHLADPDSFTFETSGESATTVIPGDHKIHLHREGGVWRIDDFDW